MKMLNNDEKSLEGTFNNIVFDKLGDSLVKRIGLTQTFIKHTLGVGENSIKLDHFTDAA